MSFKSRTTSIGRSSQQLFNKHMIIFVLMALGFNACVNILYIIDKNIARHHKCTDISNKTKEDLSLYSIGQIDIGHVAGHFFLADHVIYADGIAYDIYSIHELGQSKPGSQWLTFPLPNEKNKISGWMPKFQSTKTFSFVASPKTKTGLAYLDDIYVVSGPSLPDRIRNIKHMFDRHNIPTHSIQWRIDKLNQSMCDSEIQEGEHHRILNLTPGRIGDAMQQRYCAVTVQHVQIWHEIATSDSLLSLVLEDDAIFVPFFKEKFDRFVYTAIRTGALKIDRKQCALPGQNISTNEWINQNPAFVIGACANLRDSSFQSDMHNATPLLSIHKERFSRCSHAYVLTPCSAQELLRQMHEKKISFHIVDWLQIYLGNLSPTLQPFWLDPPLAYQGSQAHDLSGVTTFGRSMTQEG